MTEAQENELADMITDVAIDYANGHPADFRIAAKAAVAFVVDARKDIEISEYAELSQDRITDIWDGMPGGSAGFLKQWGYMQFAWALEEAIHEASPLLNRIRAHIANYHLALDNREHGGIAQHMAFDAICKELGMYWTRGEEAKRRAIQTKTEPQ